MNLENLEELWVIYSTGTDPEEKEPFKECYMMIGEPFDSKQKLVFSGTLEACVEYGENIKNCKTFHKIGVNT